MKINKVFHIFVIFITVFVLVMSHIASAQQMSEVEQATADARRDAEQNFSPLSWTSVGFLCGCFGLGYAYFVTPGVPVGALLGKSPVYVDAYTRVYQENVKRKRLQSTVIGCAIGSAVSTAYYYMFVLPQLNL
ncbi:hypothetical protein C6503_19345 [Candidatus Poribacteria bacterium]|nr:MAG: hypothetical protein C6503_19345 [Candidatus Poribacteria bacterium]